MTIGFDGKRAVFNNTGLGNYSRLVLEVLAGALPDASLRIYTPRMGATGRLMPLLERYGDTMKVVTPDSAVGRHAGALWRSFGITGQLRRDGVQLYHGLSNELPLNIRRSDIPSVVTVHDVIFRRLPEGYKPIDRAIYDYKMRHAVHDATRVIAISERTRDDIIEYYGVEPSKIDIVYQGCHAQFGAPISDATLRETLRRYGLYGTPYIIGVGTVEARKNQLLTVKALRGLPADIKLVLVGRRTRYAAEIDRYAAANGLTERVVWLEGIPFGDLPSLYRGSRFASYPSRYEGFGIPVIEALSAGTPVIVATGSCLEEAGGPDTPAVAPDDTDAFVAEARAILENQEHAREIVVKGRRYIERFAPRRFAEGLIETYSKATGVKIQSTITE